MDYTSFIFENEPSDVESPIFVDAEEPHKALTWNQYKSMVKRIAVGICKRGIKDGDCVAILSRNSICYYVLGNGVVATGAAFTAIPPFQKVAETVQHFQSAEVNWIFVEPDYLESAREAAAQATISDSQVIVFDVFSPSEYSGQRATLSQLLCSDETDWALCRPSFTTAARPCYRMLTSGSTGFPKAAELTHECMLARTRGQLARKTDKSGEVRWLHPIDMHHISGRGASTAAALGKQTTYISKSGDAICTIDNIARHRITHTMLHPRLAEEMLFKLKDGERTSASLHTLRIIMIAGSVMGQDMLTQLEQFLPRSAKLCVPYGSTEAGAMTTYLPSIAWIPGYVGEPTPGIEISIVDPQIHKDLGLDVEGEICCRGPTLFKCYVNNDVATQSAFLQNSRGVWHRTGDKGLISSSSGQILITGRYKDTFKVGTEEVSPVQVEAELLKHPAIYDAAVSSAPRRDNKGGSECVAYIVPRNPTLTAQEVVEFVSQRLSEHKVPTGGVIFCDKIPRSSFGKIIRPALEGIVACDGSTYHFHPLL